MKTNYFLIVLIAALVSPFMVQAQRQVFFTESMGEGAPKVEPFPSVVAYTEWHNSNITVTSGGLDSVADVRYTVVNALPPFPYPECSGASNIMFASELETGIERGFAMNGIDASAFKNIQLTFGYRKSSAAERSALDVYYSIGTTWVKLDFQFNEGVSEPVAWYRSPVIDLPQEAEMNGLNLRFVRPGTSMDSIRIDDIWLTGEPKITTAPVIMEASDVNSTGFKVAWDTYPNAISYLLDVSENVNFTVATDTTVVAAWTFPTPYVKGTVANPSIFTSNNVDQVISWTTTGNASEPVPYGSGTPSAFVSTGWEDGVYKKHFQIDVNTQGFYGLTLSSMWYSSGNGPLNMKVQYRLGTNHAWIDVPNSDLVMPAAAYGPTSQLTDLPLPSACDNQENVSVRWVMTGSLRTSGKNAYIVTSGGTGRIANLYVKGMAADAVAGYQNFAVTGTSHAVTGLDANKTYYYRVRVTDGTYVSNASEVMEVTTIATSITSMLNQQEVQVYYNPLNDCFDVKSVANISNGFVKVSDLSGRILNQVTLTGSERSVQASNLPAGVYIVTLSVNGQNFNQKCIK